MPFEELIGGVQSATDSSGEETEKTLALRHEVLSMFKLLPFPTRSGCVVLHWQVEKTRLVAAKFVVTKATQRANALEKESANDKVPKLGISGNHWHSHAARHHMFKFLCRERWRRCGSELRISRLGPISKKLGAISEPAKAASSNCPGSCLSLPAKFSLGVSQVNCVCVSETECPLLAGIPPLHFPQPWESTLRHLEPRIPHPPQKKMSRANPLVPVAILFRK